MTTYIIKRLLLLPVMMLGITFISFCMMQFAPGKPGGSSGGEKSQDKLSAKQREIMYATFHQDKPVHMRYVYWLGVVQPPPTKDEAELLRTKGIPPKKRGLLYGDLGMSMETTSIRVIDRLKDALPVTLLFNLLSIMLTYMLSVPLGVFCAVRQNRLSDRTISFALFLLYSLPSFWVAVMLIKLMVTLPPEWRLPFQGITPPGADRLTTLEYIFGTVKHMLLPLLVMTYGGLAGISRFMRSSMLDVLRADYVRMARAKGLRERLVVYRHSLRNALIPQITLLGGLLPGMIGGSVIIEAIFGIPGMGFLGFNAIRNFDYTVLMADLTLVAFLVLIGYLVSDLLYRAADPRITFENEAR